MNSHDVDIPDITVLFKILNLISTFCYFECSDILLPLMNCVGCYVPCPFTEYIVQYVYSEKWGKSKFSKTPKSLLLLGGSTNEDGSEAMEVISLRMYKYV